MECSIEPLALGVSLVGDVKSSQVTFIYIKVGKAD